MFYSSPFIVFRGENVAMQAHDEVPVIRANNEVPINGPNNTDLFNAMIYPFTRIVIYGAIWYQGKTTKF